MGHYFNILPFNKFYRPVNKMDSFDPTAHTLYLSRHQSDRT